MKRTAAAKVKKRPAVYQLSVTLRDIEPPIWRSIQVFEDTQLPRLHRILQALFNWEDYHLHEFVVGKRVYSVPGPDDELDERKVLDEKAVPLNRVVDAVGDTFEYHYDFGDDWHHDLLLESIHLAEPGAFYPCCIGGSRNGPPEDVGGPYGYRDYLDALANSDDERHEELLAWRGPFDAEDFSVESINAKLHRLFYRRPAKSRSSVAERGTAIALDSPGVAPFSKALAAVVYGSTATSAPRKRVPPGTTLPLKLTERERELILNHSFAPDELTAKLRVVPRPGEAYEVRYTLDDLDELAGYVASEGNHTKDRKLQKEWDAIHDKISAILESYTGE